MKKHPMSTVAEALRYLASHGYRLREVDQAVQKHKMSVVEIAEAVKQLKELDAVQEAGA